MKPLSRKQQKVVVGQWKRAAPALAQARDDELRRWQYDPATVDALLEIGAQSPRREDEPNGLVEMQRWFIKFARKQGLLPTVVRETPGGYSVCETGEGGVSPASSDAAGEAAPLLHVLGDAAILSGPKVALFCSVRCPGKLILDTYDLARRFRVEGVPVVGGFHSPMEQECLRILLRGTHPVVWCLARGLFKRVPSSPVDCRDSVAEGRLLIVSPFPATVRRTTAATAMARNRFLADLAAEVVVAHASPGSKVEALALGLLASGRRVHTFDHPANAHLLDAGAQSITPETAWPSGRTGGEAAMIGDRW